MSRAQSVRLAQIGLGAWSFAVANAVRKSNKAVLVTCFDTLGEKRRVFAENYGCEQSESYEAVLKRDDVDGVLLASPNAAHAEQTVLAARHGKHVFVTKPIANTLIDGKKMIEACEKGGVVLMVGHNTRRYSGIRKMKEVVDRGSIGSPIQVEANFSSNLGFALTPEMYRWRGDDSGCPGGSLMTMGIHYSDVFNYLFGPIKTVFSFFNKLYIPAPVEDVTATIFQFESGVLGYLGSNYGSPRTHWIYVYGTEANLLCTVTQPQWTPGEDRHRAGPAQEEIRLQIFEKGKTGSNDIPLMKVDPVVEEIEEFADCIHTGTRPETDGPGALTALALIRAAIESARTGKPAPVEM